MNFYTIDSNTLTQLQSFSSVDEMNEQIASHKKIHNLSKTDRDILDAMSRYACKYVGVCYLSKQKLAEAAGFSSRRTAIRACQRMENLGIIKQYETRRVTGDRRQAANIIVIQLAEKSISKEDVSTEKKDQSHRKVTPASHTKEAFPQSFYQTNTYEDTYIDTEYVIKRGLKRQIPEPIYEAFTPFFNGSMMYEMYGVLLRAKTTLDPACMLEDYADRYVDVFYNVIRLYKFGKVKNLANYLYVVWSRLTAEINRQRAHELA